MDVAALATDKPGSGIALGHLGAEVGSAAVGTVIHSFKLVALLMFEENNPVSVLER
jgi:hypothetical protein